MNKTLALILLVAGFISVAVAQKPSPKKDDAGKTINAPADPHLSEIRTIFIAEFTRNELADTFRALLSEKLTSKGYKVAAVASAADGTMIGNLSVDQIKEGNKLKASIMLFAGSAKELWEGAVDLRKVGGVEDGLSSLAEALAGRFDVAWKKDAKKRGIRLAP